MSGFSTRLEEVYIFQETRKSVPGNQKVISIGYSLIRISLPWQFKVSFSWCIMIVAHQKSWCCRIFFFLVVQIWSLSVSCSAELKDLACGVHVQSGGNDLFWFFFFFFKSTETLLISQLPPSSPTGQMKTFIPLFISLWHSKTLYFPALLFIHLSFIFLIYFLTFNLPRPFIPHTIIPPGTPQKSKCHCKDSSCAFPFKTHNLHTLCFLDFCFVCIYNFAKSTEKRI